MPLKVRWPLDGTNHMHANPGQKDHRAVSETLNGSSLVHGGLTLPQTSTPSDKDGPGEGPVEAADVSRRGGPRSLAKATAAGKSAEAHKRRRSSRSALGDVLQKRRHALGMTQRELAGRLGVKGAHVAYLEGGRRRPSLGLLGRIAEVLGLDREQLFALAHPEVSSIFGRKRQPTASGARGAAWAEFKKNRALRAQHQINARELKVLSQVNLLGKISSPRHFMFILNAIRQAVDEE